MTISVLLSLCAAPGLRAQRDIDPQANAAASVDITKPYQPPGALKSVEIGNFYLKQKKYTAALSRFREAIQTDPEYPPAYLGLGRAYEKIGLKQSALESYRKYLDLLPSQKAADEAKDVHRAINRLEKKVSGTGSDPQPHRPL